MKPCPICGAETIGTFECVYGVALMDDRGNYTGSTEINWNSQITLKFQQRPIYVCENGCLYTEVHPTIGVIDRH